LPKKRSKPGRIWSTTSGACGQTRRWRRWCTSQRSGGADAQPQQPANAEVQAQLGGRYIGVEYQDLIADVKAELMESVQGRAPPEFPISISSSTLESDSGKRSNKIWRCSTASMKSALWGFLFCWAFT